jgi:NAD(P)-dependent dehydrogenase (short-subunit alcohol dehydrogenase family)
MEGLLKGRRALVTGAGSGIGEGIALGMARAGAFVIAVDINDGAAMRTATRICADAAAYALDVTDRAAVDALAAQVAASHGGIDVLVNNAGIIRRGTVEDEAARADWDATLSVNLDGVFNMVTAFLAQLKAAKGCIVNIGSIQSFVALPNSAAYTASKAAVRGLTQHLATELSPHGVRVNAIGPGLIATPLNARARQNPDYMRNFQHRVPMGRIGTPEDIAGPAVFLASDMARYVTGITMPVDGGFLAF